MNTIGTCSICGGAVQVPDNDASALPKCVNCGATAESPHGATVKMQAADAPSSSVNEIRATLEAVVDRWCPKINPNTTEKATAKPSFEQRMANALLNVNAFEIDYRRVIAGGKALRGNFPLPMPTKEPANA